MKFQRINPKIFYILPLLAAGCIFFASSIPQDNVPDMPFEFGDKVVHFIAYFILGCAILFALIPNINGKPKKYIAILTVIIGAIYAASDEFHQSFVPGRSVELFDWLADVAGLMASLLTFSIFERISRYLNSKNNQI